MPAIINPVITDAGLSAAVNAANNGLRLEITHIALGTGRYDPVTSAPGMVAMAGLKEAVTIGAGASAGTGSFTLAVRFESWTGTPNPYNATEIGFYAGDPSAGGILFAVHSHPSDVVVQRNQLDYVASFTLQLTRVPAGSVTVQINPDGPQMLALLNLHLNANDPHTQYLKRTGDTASNHINGPKANKNDNSQKYATTSYVLNVGQNYPEAGFLGITTNITLTTAWAGCVADVQTPGVTVTLPKTEDCRVGMAFTVRMAAGSGAGFITAQGADQILNFAGATKTHQMSAGDTLTFVRNNLNNWYVLGGHSGVPVGSTTFVIGNSAPPGWLKLNGVLLSRAAYPALWSFATGSGVVSENDWWSTFFGRFSIGTNGSDFRLPDARGLFLRAHDDGRGIDSGRAWGAYQDQSNQPHTHGIYDPGHAHGVYDPGHSHTGYTSVDGNHTHGVPDSNNHDGWGASFDSGGYQPGWFLPTSAGGSHQHSIQTYGAGANLGIYGGATGISVTSSGTEARPRNLAMTLCIKY